MCVRTSSVYATVVPQKRAAPSVPEQASAQSRTSAANILTLMQMRVSDEHFQYVAIAYYHNVWEEETIQPRVLIHCIIV